MIQGTKNICKILLPPSLTAHYTYATTLTHCTLHIRYHPHSLHTTHTLPPSLTTHYTYATTLTHCTLHIRYHPHSLHTTHTLPPSLTAHYTYATTLTHCTLHVCYLHNLSILVIPAFTVTINKSWKKYTHLHLVIHTLCTRRGGNPTDIVFDTHLNLILTPMGCNLVYR